MEKDNIMIHLDWKHFSEATLTGPLFLLGGRVLLYFVVYFAGPDESVDIESAEIVYSDLAMLIAFLFWHFLL